MNHFRLDQSFTRWEELLQLILASFAYMDGRIDPPSSAIHLTPASLAEKASVEIAYAIAEGDQLLGCVFLRPEPDCLYVGKLAVSPHAQGKGIGRQLMNLAEDTATSLGLATLRLDVRVELTGNQAIFAAWGFAKTAERSHAGFDRITQIEMRKALSA